MSEAVWCLAFRTQEGAEFHVYTHLIPPNGSVVRVNGDYYQETKITEIDYDSHTVLIEVHGP